jgi:hypothetical protein
MNVVRSIHIRNRTLKKKALAPLYKVIKAPLRTAFIIYGRIDGYEHCLENLIDLKKRFNADFFCSLNKEQKTPYHQKLYDRLGMKPEQIRYEKTPTAPDYVLYLQDRTPPEYQFMYSAFYHEMRTFELLESYEKKHQMRYDCVVVYRADIETREPLFIKELKANTIYIPEGDNWGGVSALFAYGTRAVMQHYCFLFKSLETLCAKGKEEPRTQDYKTVGMNHEFLILLQMKANGINIKRFPHDYNLHAGRHAKLPEYQTP